jgi:hypothetical protein
VKRLIIVGLLICETAWAIAQCDLVLVDIGSKTKWNLGNLGHRSLLTNRIDEAGLMQRVVGQDLIGHTAYDAWKYPAVRGGLQFLPVGAQHPTPLVAFSCQQRSAPSCLFASFFLAESLQSRGQIHNAGSHLHIGYDVECWGSTDIRNRQRDREHDPFAFPGSKVSIGGNLNKQPGPLLGNQGLAVSRT